MALGQNMLLIFVALGLILTIAGYGTNSQGLSQVFGINTTIDEANGSQAGSVSGGLLNDNFKILLIGGGILAGSILFPNPYLIFAGLATMLIGLAPLTYDMIVSLSLPLPAQLIIGGFVGASFVLTVIAFLKGGEW